MYYICDLNCGKCIATGNIQIIFNLYQNPYKNVAVATHPPEDALLNNLLC